MFETLQWKDASGLEIVLVPRKDRPIAHLRFVIPLGCYHDPVQMEGLASFMTNLMLRGTTKRSRDDLNQDLELLGAQLDVNCGFHTSVFEATVLTKNLDKLLDILIEIVTKPLFSQREFEMLRAETMAHMKLKLESDAALARSYFLAAIHGCHPYGRDPQGNLMSIKNITLDTIKSFYHQTFDLRSCVLGAAGYVDESSLTSFGERLSSFFGSTSKKAEQLIPSPNLKPGTTVIFVDKPDRSQSHFFIGHTGLPINHPDYLPVKVFMTGFAGPIFQAQYMQEIRVKRGWAYGAYGSLDSNRDAGATFLYTYPKLSDTKAAIDLSLKLYEKAVHGSSVLDHTIEFSKNYLTRYFPFEIDTAEDYLKEYVYCKLVGKPANYLETYVDTLRSLDLDVVRSAAHHHLCPADRVIVILATAKELRDKLKKSIVHQHWIDSSYQQIVNEGSI